jgi:LysR family transcriptional regulator for bpeEF and oprC
MDRLDAIAIFVRVVESGSFSAVAREMGLGQPAISKQVAALEAHLGAQLLRRTSRSLSLTEAGQDFYESSVRLIGDLAAAESRIGHRQASPSGLVRVTVAHAFGGLYLVPRLPTFLRRYPEVTVEVLASERTPNLVEDGIDVAVRNGALADSSLVARRVGATPVVTVATPDYLAQRGEPTRPDELDKHDGIVFVSQGGPRSWRFNDGPGEVSYQPHGRFRTNDAEQIRVAVLAGLGIAQAPHWLFADELAAGRVHRLLKGYEPGEIPISAVRPQGRRLARKVSVFIDFLVEVLAADTRMSA